MKTNHVKTWILSISDEIVAYLHDKLHILNKSTSKKIHFSTTSGKKSAKFEHFRQNNCLLMKPIKKKSAVIKYFYLGVFLITLLKINFLNISTHHFLDIVFLFSYSLVWKCRDARYFRFPEIIPDSTEKMEFNLILISAR